MQEECNDFKSLMDHKGWQRFVEYSEGQINLKYKVVLGPVPDLLKILVQEFEKGELSGIAKATQFPAIRVADIEEDIMAIEKELGYATGERTEPDRRTDHGAANDVGGDFEPPT